MTTIGRSLLVLCMLGVTTPLWAAEPSRDLTTMSVKVGKVLYVKVVDGVEREGRFVRASRQDLVISVTSGREVTLTVDQIAQVWKRGDRLRNGAIIGAIFGAVTGIAGYAGCVNCTEVMTVGVAVGVPVWAGIGALIDRAYVGRTLIYQAP